MAEERTRLYERMPDETLVFVRTNPHTRNYPLHFQCVYLKPVVIGTAQQISDRAFVFEDGTKTSNFTKLKDTLLLRVGAGEFNSKFFDKPAAQPQSFVCTMQGLDLVAVEKWRQFCRLRKIDPTDKTAMQATYEISDAEYRHLNLGILNANNPKKPPLGGL